MNNERGDKLAKDDWTRVCQDELGDRPKCETLTKDSMHADNRVIIDRCNMDPTQRSHWTN